MADNSLRCIMDVFERDTGVHIYVKGSTYKLSDTFVSIDETGCRRRLSADFIDQYFVYENKPDNVNDAWGQSI